MSRNLTSILSGILILAPLFGWGCRVDDREKNDGPMTAAVTVPPQKWLVSQIGGEKVSCVVLIPANQDPHTFTGTDADAARLARCRVFFSIGLPVENSPWCRAISQQGGLRIVSLADAAHFHRNSAPPVQKVAGETEPHLEEAATRSDAGTEDASDRTSEGVQFPENERHQRDEHDHEVFLHTWLSPRRLVAMGEILAQTLEELDPSNGALYRDNWERLRSQLLQLDEELREKLAPLKGQEFFVFHPAWECFAADYGLVQVALESHGKEPSDHEITELQRRAQRARIKVMLVQPQISSRAAHAVAEAAGLRLVTVNPLAEDIPHELRHVAETLVSAYRERIKSSNAE